MSVVFCALCLVNLFLMKETLLLNKTRPHIKLSQFNDLVKQLHSIQIYVCIGNRRGNLYNYLLLKGTNKKSTYTYVVVVKHIWPRAHTDPLLQCH